MTLRLIASAVVAALLMVGSITAPPQTDPAAPAPPAQTAEPAVQVTTLSQQEAQAIALRHAGLTAAQVTELRTQYDRDDRIPHWEVEFRHGDWEYDYDIHGATGEILKWEKEFDPAPTVPPAPPVTEPVPTPTQRLTAEEAKTLALRHAGLTAAQVTRLKAEFDWDDGIPEYEVEFISGGFEYEYDIHAETGKILSWDKDWDD